MRRLSQRGRADFLVTGRLMEHYNSWRIRLEGTPFASAAGTFWVQFVPTDQSLYTENANTDDCQDDNGLIGPSFRLCGPDMQLSVVYRM